MKAKIGVIGGSGLYQLPGLENVRDHNVTTAFGDPSDTIKGGTLDGTEVYFLPRHGRGHRFTPSEVNYRANIAALKKLGVTHIISLSAVGSMKEEIVPGHFVLIDQFIDWTKGKRESTFYGEGVVGHMSLADPVCNDTLEILADASKDLDFKIHKGGTYICIEGPQFSTKAESYFYRSMGVSVIGMTNVPECKLAREAGVSYCTVAMSTDFDCWHDGHDAVTVEEVVKTVNANVEKAKEFLSTVIPAVAERATFPFQGTGLACIMTAEDARREETMGKLNVILGEQS